MTIQKLTFKTKPILKSIDWNKTQPQPSLHLKTCEVNFRKSNLSAFIVTLKRVLFQARCRVLLYTMFLNYSERFDLM